MPSHRRLSRAGAACAFALATLPAQTPQQTTIPVTATVTTQPPAIAFQWPLEPSANGYQVYRRNAGAVFWGVPTVVPGGGAATAFTDTNVQVGARYEYWFSRAGIPAGKALLTAGIAATALEFRGRVVLIVDATQAPALGARLDRLVQDLVGDGWEVIRHDVLPTASVPSVRGLIQADVATWLGEVKAVFLLGHVPVPYSGSIAPDGHTDHIGAWPADVYYGDVDGIWTDTTLTSTGASRVENRNSPGDGKFDQSSLPSDVDLQVGRVDLANLPSFALGETALLQQYLDKDHDYRHKVFACDQRAVIDDNFGYFGGEAFAASGWGNFAHLLGPANIVAADYFTTLDVPTGNGHVWSYGCGGGWYQGASGVGSTTNFTTARCRSVFTMLFGSYFGDWDSTDNFLRAPLASGWTLTDAWAGRPQWVFHPLGLGNTIGACARLSQNDTTAGGYGARMVHVALMGDPTLRLHVIAPPGQVVVTDTWPTATVSWTPSADAVAGYHVYRADAPQGPFTRLDGTLVPGTAFTDPSPRAGDATYMVRAVRLETVPTGSYWNLSQGVFASVRLPQAAAANLAFGHGCDAVSDSFYQYFATPAAAQAGLQGRAITLVPTATGYTVDHGGVYVPPGAGATPLQLGDDAATTVTPSQPLPVPGGSAAALVVHSNGIVATAPLALAGTASATPGPAAMLAEAAAAWYCWHDFDPSEPGSGQVLAEEVAGTLYLTWNQVESHPAGANPSTVQFQFELATGVVRLLWPSITALGTGQGTAPSEQFLVGWSPGGASTDAGPVDLTSALPLLVGNQNQEPLTLAATPAPVVTAGTGITVTYTVSAVPPMAPGSHVAAVVFGFVDDRAGTSLAGLGMPRCAQHLGSLDLCLFTVGTTSSLSVPLHLPAGLPGGTSLFAQAVALFPPGSLPNGMNPFGAVTSNGLQTFVNDH